MTTTAPDCSTEGRPPGVKIGAIKINDEYSRVVAYDEEDGSVFSHEKAAGVAAQLSTRLEGEPNGLLLQAINQFMSDALIAIAGAVATPEKGYVKDGGLQLLLSDIKRLRKQHDQHKARNGVVAAQVEERDARIAELTRAAVTTNEGQPRKEH